MARLWLAVSVVTICVLVLEADSARIKRKKSSSSSSDDEDHHRRGGGGGWRRGGGGGGWGGRDRNNNRNGGWNRGGGRDDSDNSRNNGGWNRGGDRDNSRDRSDNSRDNNRGGGGGGWNRGGGGGRRRNSNCRLLGCYVDTPGNRLLRGLNNQNDYGLQDGQMTVDMCADECSGYKYTGLEFGSYCFCANKYSYRPQRSDNCNMNCAADSGQTCGGSNAIEVYQC